MAMTVREALEIGKLKRGVVVAGEKGLDRIVSYVDIQEVPDISGWIRSEELLLTTGYAIKDSQALQQKLILELAQKNAAGIIIKINRFLKSVPENMIDLANQYSIPIIQLPPDIPYIEITHTLYKEILMRQNQERWVSDKLKEILVLNKYKDSNRLKQQMKSINSYFDFTYPFVIILIQCGQKGIFERYVNMENIKSNPKAIYAWIDSSFVLIYSITNKENWERNIIKELFKNDKLSCSDKDFMCMISKLVTDVQNIYSIYSYISYAARQKSNFHENKNIYFFDQIIHYVLLNSISNLSISKKFVKYMLEPLEGISHSERELITNTLYAYVKSDGNITKSAEKCFVHRNTFIYRMKKVRKIFNNDFDCCEERFKYRLALELYKILAEK
ncbi:MAG: PucR family transcriptional regulator [Clostridia bacterium]|nr:PucR family transcriptional regulator [Clostridia bacterium]